MRAVETDGQRESEVGTVSFALIVKSSAALLVVAVVMFVVACWVASAHVEDPEEDHE